MHPEGAVRPDSYVTPYIVKVNSVGGITFEEPITYVTPPSNFYFV